MPVLTFHSKDGMGKYQELRAIMRYPDNIKKQQLYIINYLKTKYAEQLKIANNTDCIDDEEIIYKNLSISIQALDAELIDKLGGLKKVMESGVLYTSEETANDKIDKIVGLCMLILFVSNSDKRFMNQKNFSSLTKLINRVAKGDFLGIVDEKATERTIVNYWSEKKDVVHLVAADFLCDKIEEFSNGNTIHDNSISRMYDPKLKFEHLMRFAKTLQDWGIISKSSPNATRFIVNKHEAYIVPDEFEAIPIPIIFNDYLEVEINRE